MIKYYLLVVMISWCCARIIVPKPGDNPIQQNDIVGYDCTTKVPTASIISGAVGECEESNPEKPGQSEFVGYIIQAKI